MSTQKDQLAEIRLVGRLTDRVASPWFLISVGTVQTPTTVGRHGGPS
jgi:hypothetical protein